MVECWCGRPEVRNRRYPLPLTHPATKVGRTPSSARDPLVALLGQFRLLTEDTTLALPGTCSADQERVRGDPRGRGCPPHGRRSRYPEERGGRVCCSGETGRVHSPRVVPRQALGPRGSSAGRQRGMRRSGRGWRFHHGSRRPGRARVNASRPWTTPGTHPTNGSSSVRRMAGLCHKTVRSPQLGPPRRTAQAACLQGNHRYIS